LPDVISFECFGFSKDTQSILMQKGHKLKEASITSGQGSAMGIVYDIEDKVIEGYADPRSPDGGVSGY
jgi:gamma-glutamyltranspeptidase